MDVFDRNPVKSLNEVVFADKETQIKISHRATSNGATNLLFSGPAGTGKSTLCELIGRQLVGAGYETDVSIINVSDYIGKRELTDKINAISGFGRFNDLGKIVIILEEIDGAQKPAQKALKDVISKSSDAVLFLATTNDLTEVIEPIKDRFDCIQINMASSKMWEDRAVQVLANEGVRLSTRQARNLIETEASGQSGRKIMRMLDAFAGKVKAANSKSI